MPNLTGLKPGILRSQVMGFNVHFISKISLTGAEGEVALKDCSLGLVSPPRGSTVIVPP